MAGFDLFKLPEEHDELRAVLRDLCETEIAPYAADVDEHARFPEEALKVLNDTGFSAVHVPEEYGGQGADAVAVARGRGSRSGVRVLVADSRGQQAWHDRADSAWL